MLLKLWLRSVVYIRKVKKSESKSQPAAVAWNVLLRLCISVKLKNLKANHNFGSPSVGIEYGCVYP